MTLVEEQITPVEIRRIKGMPRAERPRCGAKTRRGTPCQAQALLKKDGTPGRCKNHGGMSTGPRTEAGRKRQAEAARQSQIKRWERMRAEGITSLQMSDDAKKRMAEASSKRLRMRHRRRQAIEWADWITEQLEQRASWPREYNSRAIIIEPFRKALEHGGLREMIELASLTELKVERFMEDGCDIYATILHRYSYHARRLAEEFRAGAER